jgi:hypothetical protein
VLRDDDLARRIFSAALIYRPAGLKTGSLQVEDGMLLLIRILQELMDKNENPL